MKKLSDPISQEEYLQEKNRGLEAENLAVCKEIDNQDAENAALVALVAQMREALGHAKFLIEYEEDHMGRDPHECLADIADALTAADAVAEGESGTGAG